MVFNKKLSVFLLREFLLASVYYVIYTKTKKQQGINKMTSNFNVALNLLMSDRDKFREENKIIIDEELNRCKVNFYLI